MRFVYQYPDTHGAEGSMLEAGDLDDMAASRGCWFDGFALTEHQPPAPDGLRRAVINRRPVRCARVCSSHRANPAVTNLTILPYRNPLLLAKSAATLALISNGRFVLGVGAGYLKGEFRALGVDFDTRNRRFDEALDVMAQHWSGEPFDYEGSDFSARGIQARPMPPEPVPIWIGGNSALTRRRVAAGAQGWMPMLGSDELLATTRTPGVGGLEGLARLIGEVKAAAGDRGAALNFVLAHHDEALHLAPTEDIDRHLAVFAAYADAGITHTVLLAPKREPAAGLEWIAAVGEEYCATGS